MNVKIVVVERTGLFPGLQLIATSDHHGNDRELQPNMSAYLKNSSSRKRTHDDDPLKTHPPFKKCLVIATPYVTQAQTDASVTKIVGRASLPAPPISAQSLAGLHRKTTPNRKPPAVPSLSNITFDSPHIP